MSTALLTGSSPGADFSCRFSVLQSQQAVLDAVPNHLCDDVPGCEWSTPGAGKSTNLHSDLAFSNEVQPAVQTRAKECLSAWMQMNILGAFDLGFEESDDLDAIGTAKTTSAYRIECWVDAA